MRFAILGRISVQDVTPIEISPMRRPLLATLLLAWPGEVSAETLMQAVWGDTFGRENALKTALSQLRRLLPGRIPPARPHGYRIELMPEDTFDLEEFRKLIQHGREHLSAGDHEAAVPCLRKALALWGDPPLADVPDDPIRLATWRQDVLWERKVAQQQLLETRLFLGEDHQLLTEIRKELAEDPLSEVLNALLMTALYRAGYRVEALHQYDTIAELLAQDTGAEPGARLRRLRDEIASDDGGPVAVPPAQERATVAQPSGGRLALTPAQLPPAVVDFIGRGGEIQQLTRYMSTAGAGPGVPIACICGPPGVGKSTLSHQVAQLVRQRFPDGQLYLHMAGTSERPREIGDVLAEVLSALGTSPADAPPTVSGRTALYRSLMAGRRVLVVLDDVSSMHQIQPLLPGNPGCAVLVTSRSHLVGGAGMRTIRLEPLSSHESQRLLGDIIGAHRVEAEPEAAADITRTCGGFPLAVRVAGARLSAQPDWPLGMFAERLRKRLLTVLSTDDMTIEASIATSYDALPESTQRIFRLVSLLGPGGFAGWEVAMLHGGTAEDVEDVLESLTGHSLLSGAGVDSLGQLRYQQHALLRAFGAARLAELPIERDTAMHRLLMGWLELASLADVQIVRAPVYPPLDPLGISMFGAVPVRQLISERADEWLAAEIGNLLNVVRIACEEKLPHQAFGLALRVTSYLYRESRHVEAEDMWRRVLKAVLPFTGRRVTEARHRLASLIMERPGGPLRALPLVEECVAACEANADRQGLARALALRALCRHQIALDHEPGERRITLLAQAETDARRGLLIARDIGRTYAQLNCLNALAVVSGACGSLDRALELGSEALALAEELASSRYGHEAYLAQAAQTLGALKLASPRHELREEALALFERAGELSRTARHREGQARAHEGAGDALVTLERHQRASECYARATALWEEIGAAEAAVRCRGKLGSPGTTQVCAPAR
ncbi:AfsR/SARP family transcriptional regulator [Nonomuraea aridisoli]|uniref:AfsR/SARP family transcriptional regulator n=1 Tax=Nonomuraea aridisoli TaxID=2070368 RepID=UPI0015E8AB3F|nr:BTAD domain-containing putative transcriptional regulator [Nonomuraea aridisoli]